MIHGFVCGCSTGVKCAVRMHLSAQRELSPVTLPALKLQPRPSKNGLKLQPWDLLIIQSSSKCPDFASCGHGITGLLRAFSIWKEMCFPCLFWSQL